MEVWRVSVLRWPVVSAVLWLTAIGHAHAQQAIPDSLIVSGAVDQERLTIGDPLRYTVTVVSPPGVSIDWPGRQRMIGPFDVQAFEHDGPYAGANGQYADTLRYTLTVYTVGVQTIPPLELPYTRADGTQRTAMTDAFEITVVSVIDDEATDIRDLKNPADLPESIPWYVWAGIAAILIALIAAAIYYYRYRGRSEELPEAPTLAPPKLPHEIAYEELDQLAEDGWLKSGQITRHYTILSEIIRRYLSARYNILAMEITTTELIELLGSLDIKPEYRIMITEFLYECDLVKFARFTPEQERMDRSIRDAREIVAETKVMPEPMAPAASSDSSVPTNA